MQFAIYNLQFGTCALTQAAASLAGAGKSKDAEALYLDLSRAGAAHDIRGAAIVGLARLGSPKALPAALDGVYASVEKMLG